MPCFNWVGAIYCTDLSLLLFKIFNIIQTLKSSDKIPFRCLYRVFNSFPPAGTEALKPHSCRILRVLGKKLEKVR